MPVMCRGILRPIRVHVRQGFAIGVFAFVEISLAIAVKAFGIEIVAMILAKDSLQLRPKSGRRELQQPR